MKHCPVIAIPNDFEFVEPKQIAYSTAFDRAYNEEQLKPLKQIAELYHSKIRVITVFPENREFNEFQNKNMMAFKELMVNYNISYHKIEDYTTKTRAITNFIEEFGIDMLVMVQNKHSFIENIFNEAIIKKIGYNPTIPLVVIPE